ncbi:MAG: Rieske 2Fe-2S domain-containing protein [Ilumatobacter sp.]|uniref:Rieske (2Fe-2S) protein n=1 Tax=Ilumatobacter sp. TaxID=1967498 RepID=UPI0026117E67|nr:Rieske 2Fe-2S domain-containing protein [Ilumatobacter sp.]MDJ0771079.1 Rieske 2Fe-2S domain-containing protein [Ilumatobacter sp.]
MSATNADPTPPTITNPPSASAAAGTVVGHLDDLAEATMRMVKVDGHRLCLVRTSEGVFALDQACPHEGYGLTTGDLDGDLITCAWHNWKFRVSDGRCVLGEEDVRTHPVHVADDGTLSVTFVEPDPAEQRPKLLASLRSGIERDYTGQVARDVVRLLRADANPGELIWEAVAYGAPRAEFGWGHAVASLTDCLAMVEHYEDDDRALPIVQAIAGVAEGERDRPVRPLPDPARDVSSDPRAEFRGFVEREQLEPAQAVLRHAIAHGATADDLRPWFTEVVADHHLSYGHGAIYTQKAFQLLDRLGWGRADTVLPHLLPTLVYGTREDKLPYMKLFHRGVAELDLAALAAAAIEPVTGWADDGRLRSALLGDDRTEAASAAGAALASGAGLEGVLDAVTEAVSERMLRYDHAGEFDFHDDFGWLSITHGMTYANAVRWHVRRAPEITPDLVRLVLWTVFLANWTGRHEWHTGVGEREEIEPRSTDLVEYGRSLQHEALLDGTTAFIVHAHAVKTSVAATEEAVRLDSAVPLDAVARFMAAPKLERFVAATVARSIDFLSGRVQRE